MSKLTAKLKFSMLLTIGIKIYHHGLSEPLSTLHVPLNFATELIMCEEGLVGRSLMAELQFSWSTFAEDKHCPSDLVTDFTV
jgi:hypothetical protein